MRVIFSWGIIYKIGKTKYDDIFRRFKYNKAEVVHAWKFPTEIEAYRNESKIKRKFKSFVSDIPDIMGEDGGNSECFDFDILNLDSPDMKYQSSAWWLDAQSHKGASTIDSKLLAHSPN